MDAKEKQQLVATAVEQSKAYVNMLLRTKGISSGSDDKKSNRLTKLSDRYSELDIKSNKTWNVVETMNETIQKLNDCNEKMAEEISKLESELSLSKQEFKTLTDRINKLELAIKNPLASTPKLFGN